MIPTEVVLSPESYADIATELSKNTPQPRPAQHLALNVTIREDNTDVLIVKELTPNPCPVCHGRLTFLRETIARFENDALHLIRCPMGHRYPGQLRIFQIDIRGENREREKPITTCPACGSKSIQYLGPAEMFCLDCDWDSGLEPRFQPNAS